MKYEDERQETPFATRDTMLDIRRHITELCFRGFGLKKRKPAKEPKNFAEWSEVSRARWKQTQDEIRAKQEAWDIQYIKDESTWLRNTCRDILNLISKANIMNPQTEHECDVQRDMQNEAIGLCDNLQRELTYIADTIPCNKNFLVQQYREIDKEIALLRGWRKSCNPAREQTMKRDAARRLKAEKAIMEAGAPK